MSHPSATHPRSCRFLGECAEIENDFFENLLGSRAPARLRVTISLAQPRDHAAQRSGIATLRGLEALEAGERVDRGDIVRAFPESSDRERSSKPRLKAAQIAKRWTSRLLP